MQKDVGLEGGFIDTSICKMTFSNVQMYFRTGAGSVTMFRNAYARRISPGWLTEDRVILKFENGTHIRSELRPRGEYSSFKWF